MDRVEYLSKDIVAIWNTRVSPVPAATSDLAVAARKVAGKAAHELDRNALLYASRDDRPLTTIELESTIAIIAAALRAEEGKEKDG